MIVHLPEQDLVVLVADLDMRLTIEALLRRPPSFDIKAVSYEIFSHPERDPGCFRKAPAFLAPFSGQYRYALVLFDRHGCGRDEATREELEQDVENRFAATDWRDRVAAIAIDPELEIWVWSDSPKVDRVLGWTGRNPSLREWLKEEKKLWPVGSPKPDDPKTAMKSALRNVRKPLSSSLFRNLADTVSVHRCTDPAFDKFKATLSRWFPTEPSTP
jgi:hypothetical protein